MRNSEFDRFATDYEALHAANIKASGETPEYFAEYKIRDVARRLEASGAAVGRILDFGGGVGNSAPFFNKYFPDSRLTSADPSAKSTAIARERYPEMAEYVEMDGDVLPFADESFDLVFSSCVFHHIPATLHQTWLRELHRVCRKGGALAIYEHNPLNPLTVHAVNTCPFDADAQLIRASVLRRTIESAGWRRAGIAYKVFFPAALAWARPAETYLRWLPLGAQYAVVALHE